jgi:DNA-binding response OmpR family regulator
MVPCRWQGRVGVGRVIVIGGDLGFRQMLSEELGRAGHEMTAAPAAEAVESLVSKGRAELLVLDLRSSGEDGVRLARRMRERLGTSILLLSREGDAAGCAANADACITPPVAPSELADCIDGMLRRRGAGEAVAFGPYRLDLRAFDVLGADGFSLGLMPMEVDLVAAFATNPGRVLSRGELLRLAPPRGEGCNGRSIDHRVTRLRRKLERNPARPELIKTVRGAGYVFPGIWRGSL